MLFLLKKRLDMQTGFAFFAVYRFWLIAECRVLSGTGGAVLLGKVHIGFDRVSRKHGHETDLVAAALALRKGYPLDYGNEMRHPVGVMVNAIHARPRSNFSRHKPRR